MNLFKKAIAVVIAAILVVSAASCSLTKQSSYKYGDKTYDIGVYIYSLYSAYTTAQGYAEKVKDYKESESFMDLKIADDDGEKAVARDWIKDKADEAAKELVVVDKLIDEKKVDIAKSELETAEESCKSAWEMGPYAAYSAQYYNPLKDQLEDYGISFDSFKQLYISPVGSSIYAVKTSKLFDAIYGKGGSEEVSDSDLEKFFTENYLGYSSIPVNLYSSETDSDGNSSSKAYSDKKIKKITAALEDYASKIASGELSFDDASKKIQKAYGVEESSVTSNSVDTKENLEKNNEDIFKALKKLENGKASVITVGKDGDSPSAYLIVKNDLKDEVKNYVKGDKRTSVLQNMKSDDFKKFLKDQAKKLSDDKKFEKNSGAIDSYDPNMFFTKPDTSSSSSSSSSKAE